MIPILMHPEWHASAKCRGATIVFWPDREYDEEGRVVERVSSAEVKRAKAICNGRDGTDIICPVREECLCFALRNRERFGVWGGKSERELRLLQRQENRVIWLRARRSSDSFKRVVVTRVSSAG